MRLALSRLIQVMSFKRSALISLLIKEHLSKHKGLNQKLWVFDWHENCASFMGTLVGRGEEVFPEVIRKFERCKVKCE